VEGVKLGLSPRWVLSGWLDPGGECVEAAGLEEGGGADNSSEEDLAELGCGGDRLQLRVLLLQLGPELFGDFCE
jgi:hypothetical protein